MDNNLPELRDIHLPSDEISVFPLAYGWWGILLFAVALIFLVKAVLWIRRTSAAIYARKLLQGLQDNNSLSAVVKMSEILRRVCVRQYPQAVSLFGNEWIEFLNSKSKKQLDEQTAELLKNAPFMQENSADYSAEKQRKLWQFCYDWIGENL